MMKMLLMLDRSGRLQATLNPSTPLLETLSGSPKLLHIIEEAQEDWDA